MAVKIPFLPVLLACLLAFAAGAVPAKAQDMQTASQRKKQADLSEREKAVRAEEERLLSLRKDLDERIAKYEALLSRFEEAVKKSGDEETGRLDHLVKAFDAMPPDEAAARLSALDDSTAVRIVARMKSRKAGQILAAMPPAKAAVLAKRMSQGVKNFPTK